MKLANIAIAGLLAATAATSAFADAPANSPLAAGKPAGVKQAQLAGNGLLLAIGIGAVVAAAVVVATTNGGHNVANSTNSTTP